MQRTPAPIVLIATVVLLALALGATTAAASNAIAKKEGLVCTACHDKPGSKLLTDRGKYYELMGSLDAFDELHQQFAKCTYCHVRKPGSMKLTKIGRRYQWMMGDMTGIKKWLLEQHPALETKEPGSEAAGESGDPGDPPID